MTATGWEPDAAVWRNGVKYYRELDGRSRMETSTNYLARDRFSLSGEGEPSAAVDRSEYSGRGRLQFDETYWVAYSLLLHEARPTSWFVLNQFHDVPDAGEPVVPPPLTATLVPGKEAFAVHVRSAQPGRRRQFEENEVYRAESFARGVWHQLVYRVRFTQGTGGHISIWHGGVQVADGEVPMGFADRVGPYFKFGAYRDPTAGDALVEYANVELSTGTLLARVDEPLPLRPVPAAFSAAPDTSPHGPW